VHAGVFVCFLFLICGASRLARFNISINPQPRKPRQTGAQVFCGDADSGGRGRDCGGVHCFSGSPIYDPRTALVWLGADSVCGVP